METFSIKQIIKILGGNEGAAKLLGISPHTVLHWSVKGIPAKHWMYITQKEVITYKNLELYHPDKFKRDRCA